MIQINIHNMALAYKIFDGNLQWDQIALALAKNFHEILTSLRLLLFCRLKHFLRCATGTLHNKSILQPKLFINQSGTHECIIVIPVDAKVAALSKSRKSTSGVLIEFLGGPVHFISKTQPVIAQS